MISISSEGRKTGYYGDGYQLPTVQQSTKCLVWSHNIICLCGCTAMYLLSLLYVTYLDTSPGPLFFPDNHNQGHPLPLTILKLVQHLGIALV